MDLKDKYPWIDSITTADLPTYDSRVMAEIIGLPLTIKLLTEATGSVFTMTTAWSREAMKKYIKRTYDGSKESRMHLCKICNVNENYIHKLCSQKNKN